MELCIRPGRTEDLPTLIELQNLAIQELCCKDYDSRQLTAIIKEQSRARQTSKEEWFIAEVNGEIIGFAAISKINLKWVGSMSIQTGHGKELAPN